MDTALLVSPLPTRERQRNDALKRANQVRLRRVAEGRKIESAPSDQAKALFVELLLSCPSWLESEPIGRWMSRLPRYGPSRIEKLLRKKKISELRSVGALTDRQRWELVQGLGVDLGAEPAEWPERLRVREMPRTRLVGETGGTPGERAGR